MNRIATAVLALSLVSVPLFAAGPSDDPQADRLEDPNATRLVLGPTGRTLNKGEAYIDLVDLFVPTLQVGVTDRVSLGIGAPLVFPGVKPGDVFWFTPKVQVFRGSRNQASVGVLHVKLPDRNLMGLGYGVVTHGTTDNAVTIGLGYSYRDGEHVNGGAPVALVAGEWRAGRRVKLITENYVGRAGGLLNVGLRIIGRRTSVDLGLTGPYEHGVVYVAPVVRFNRKFGPPAGVRSHS